MAYFHPLSSWYSANNLYLEDAYTTILQNVLDTEVLVLQYKYRR